MADNIDYTKAKFEVAWSVQRGTGDFGEICFTPEGNLAVVQGNYSSVLLYDSEANLLKTGDVLKEPTGITYIPHDGVLAVSERQYGNIRLLDAKSLETKHIINIKPDCYRVTMSGSKFVTLYKDRNDQEEQVMIYEFNRHGSIMNSWTSPSHENEWFYLTSDDKYLYLTDREEKLYIHNKLGQLVQVVTVGKYTHGVTCVEGQILVVLSGYHQPGHLAAISKENYSVKNIIDWGENEKKMFGCMRSVAVHKDMLAIAGIEGICVYKIVT